MAPHTPRPSFCHPVAWLLLGDMALLGYLLLRSPELRTHLLMSLGFA